MNILAIDTSTKDLSMAIQTDNGTFYQTSKESLQHSKIIFSELETLLEKACVNKEEIHCISVNLGPGSFTGIRIGVVFAKGMAYALSTKLACCDAFFAIATECKQNLPAGIICEERNGGGYFATARLVNGKVEISDRGVYKSEEIAKIMAREGISTMLCSTENKIGATTASGVVGLLQVGKEACESGNFCEIEQLEPVYIKKSQAEEQLEEKLKKASD